MRKLSVLVALVAVVMGGVAVAQTRTSQDIYEQIRKSIPEPQCNTPDDVLHKPDAVVRWNDAAYRCAYTYDSWLTKTNRVAWVRVAE
jgi:hypothetical protein